MTDKPDGKDGPTLISENALLGVSIGIVGISTLCVAGFYVLLAMSLKNAVLVMLGTLSGFIGPGVSIWFTFRTKRLAFLAVSIWSLLPLAFWLWIFYGVFIGRIRF